jgi:hypothetical protein
VFLTGFVEDGMTLSSVFAELGVDEVDEIASDGGGEDAWHGDTAGDFLGIVTLVDGHNWSGGHFE